MVGQVRIRQIDVDLAYFWLKCGLICLVDVREPAEYRYGIIEKAILHPFSTFEPAFLPYVDPLVGVPPRLLFYCQKGAVAPQAAQAWAEEIGASVAFVLKGGIEQWQEEQLPIESYPKEGN